MEQLIASILADLYDSYIQQGHKRKNYNDYIISNGFDPREIGNIMNDRGLIRHYQVTNGLSAVISVNGINVINPNFFPQHAAAVISHAKNNGNITTIRTALPQLPVEIAGGVVNDIGQYIRDRNMANIQIGRQDVRVYL